MNSNRENSLCMYGLSMHVCNYIASYVTKCLGSNEEQPSVSRLPSLLTISFTHYVIKLPSVSELFHAKGIIITQILLPS